MSSEAMALGSIPPPISPRLIKSLGESREKRVMTTEEFDRILKNEPPARLTLASARRGSLSNTGLENTQANQHSPRRVLRKQISFDNFSHKLQHKAVSRPPRTSVPYVYSNSPHAPGSLPPILCEDIASPVDHGFHESDTETNSDTSSSGPLGHAEKKSLSSLIKKTFGKKSRKYGDRETVVSSDLLTPQSPSASFFNISPQASPVESLFDHNKSTSHSLKEQYSPNYPSPDERDDDEEEDWTDTGLPVTPPPLLRVSSRSFSTPTLPLLPTDKPHPPPHSIASPPFQLGPAPKSDNTRKLTIARPRTALPLPEPTESPRSTKVTFKPEQEVIHFSGEDSPEDPVARSRSSSFSSNESFHTMTEEKSSPSSQPLPPNTPTRPAIPKFPSILKDPIRNDKERETQIEALRLENSNLTKELEKMKRQLSLEHSARTALLKSMENARSQFDEISAQAYRKLRQVSADNRRLTNEMQKLKERLETLDV
ncbi:hypothetical protein K493DRAFT_307524 [Basidiobolus meristosporus CBS 931.73]|uniref:Uncharacterized protein n=1 Tax=Basidiobolus meristosporus CBS 931.73 TaxID=1314790 RepID=A0A1Y1XE03_9FUNG|nr:hypothetical protein K493DRAFT_307524 [Basidiobolus meristosporus CBS 931.73]|eukprot:ORX83953.1 hypothetical protein K493DRAFT_307524 [Basidiobolus meristosporus CBS 931.73]